MNLYRGWFIVWDKYYLGYRCIYLMKGKAGIMPPQPTVLNTMVEAINKVDEFWLNEEYFN